MKSLKKYIREEITKLQEAQYPIIRYVENLKAINSIPPSYRVFLHNGEFFDIIHEEFSLLVKIGSKEYYLNNISEKNYAIQHINRLLTGFKVKPEEEEDMGGDLGSDLPPPPGAPTEPEI